MGSPSPNLGFRSSFDRQASDGRVARRHFAQARGLIKWLVAMLFLVVSTAHAVTPESGMYWDSRRDGLGYYVEVQGTTVMLIAFAYDQLSGKPVFYLASGQMTRSEPRYSAVFTPPIKVLRENAYQFEGTLYKFDEGPCLICGVRVWDTSEYANPVGKVYLRFADKNHMYVAFLMDDGSSIGSLVRRQLFGRHRFDVRHRFYVGREGIVTYSVPLPSFLGEWVFTPLDKPQTEAFRLNFDKVIGPVDGSYRSPGIDSDGVPLASFDGPLVQFIDTNNNAVMTCADPGCELVVDGESMLVVKYWDIGEDRILGYSGDRLVLDLQVVYYRGEHLVSGIRLADPIPAAPPPPDDGGGAP